MVVASGHTSVYAEKFRSRDLGWDDEVRNKQIGTTGVRKRTSEFAPPTLAVCFVQGTGHCYCASRHRQSPIQKINCRYLKVVSTYRCRASSRPHSQGPTLSEVEGAVPTWPVVPNAKRPRAGGAALFWTWVTRAIYCYSLMVRGSVSLKLRVDSAGRTISFPPV